MFERQFGLRENPFAAGHQARFVYPSREHQEVLAHLRFGIENREPFVLITGEVGTGKTTALYDVLAEYESSALVALITNSSLTRDELFEEICLRFGLATGGRQMTKPMALQALEGFLRQTRAQGRHAILILDEAQNLERALLEEVRQLSNLEDQGVCLLQLFLVGQPELEEKLARPELRQLRQRITVFYRVNPLGAEDTEGYIHHRIAVAGGHSISIFPEDACREVFAITHGIPREINTVAGQAMLNAFVEDSPCVKPEHVRAVERDGEFRSVLRGGAAGARIATVEARGESSPAASPSPAEPPSPVVRPASATPAVASTPVAPPPGAAPPPTAPPPPSTAKPTAVHERVPAPPYPSPRAQGPPPARPMESVPAQPINSRNIGPPLLPTDVPATAQPEAPPMAATPGTGQEPPRGRAPAGGAGAWGTWLSSFPASLEEGAATEPASPAIPSDSESGEPAAAMQAGTPERIEPPAMQRVQPPASDEPAAPAWAAVRAEFARRHEPAAPSTKAGDSQESTASDSEWSPGRKPRRLEFVDDEPREKDPRTLRVMIVAAVVAVIAVGAVLGIRTWRNATHARSQPVSVVPSSAGPNAEQSATGTSQSPPAVTQPTTETANPAGGSSSDTLGQPNPSSAGPNAGPPSALVPGGAPAAPAPAQPIPGSVSTGEPPATATAEQPPAVAATLPPVTTPPATSSASGTSAPVAGAGTPRPRAIPPRAVAPPQATFGVVVGTYLNEERAGEEREKLVASTQLPAQLLTVTENDVALFRLVMGSFVSRLQAERMASSLIERGLVDEARVIALAAPAPPKP